MVKTVLLHACLCLCCFTSVRAGDLVLMDQVPAVQTPLHSDQLRRIMQRLDHLAFEREYTELGLDRLRAEQIELLVHESQSLLTNAGRLPEILNAGTITGVEQETFTAVARQLYTETLRIQAQIRAYQFEQLPAAYQRLQRTCNACHSLFRSTD